MNRIIILVQLLVLSQYAYAKNKTLIEAIYDKSVSAIIHSSPTRTNSHTGKCLSIQLKNNTKEIQIIDIPPAMECENVNNKNQSLLVVEQFVVSLKSEEIQTIQVNALCCNKNNASPSMDDSFIIKKIMPKPYVQLCQLLQKNNCFDNCAQQALWCLQKENPIATIFDTHIDTALENKLIAFLCKELNESIPAPHRGNYRGVRVIKRPFEVDSTFQFRVESKVTLGIYITDSNYNILVPLIPDDTETRVGNLKYSFIYRGQFYPGKYKLSLRKNKEWITMKDYEIL